MPPKTDGDVAVVKPYYATEKAYTRGYRRIYGVSEDPPVDFEFSHFTETAEYAHTVLPRLRAMAGFADAGHGTYQQDRQVAAVHSGCEEDEPAEADLVDASVLLRELVDAYRRGAYDAAKGADETPPEPNL